MSMRLTLRTMLAYMEDVLEPADAQELGKKIEESEFATNLMHRIRDVTRRLRLAAPKLDGKGIGLDPNTVAEYLDNLLPSERVADFEKVCLESDVHLAEVASCHQILALILGAPAEIDPAMRDRMYKVPLKLVAPPPAAAVTAPPVSITAPPVESEESPLERKRPEVPEYLREPSARSAGSRSMLAMAVVVLLLIGGGVLGAMQFGILPNLLSGKVAEGPKNSPSAIPAATPLAVGQDAKIDSQVPPKVGAGTALPAAGQPGVAQPSVAQPPAASNPSNVASESNQIPGSASGQVVPTGQPPANQQPVMPVGTNPVGPPQNALTIPPPATPGAAPAIPPLSAPSGTVPPGTVPPGTVPPGTVPPGQISAGVAAGANPVGVPLTALPPTTFPMAVPPSGAPQVAGPAPAAMSPAAVGTVPGNAAPPFVASRPISPAGSVPVTATGMGRLISEHEVLLRYDWASKLWKRLMTRASVAQGDRLLSLPSYRANLTLGPSLSVQMLGGTSIELLPPDARDVPGFELLDGRVLILPLGKPGAPLRFKVGAREAYIVFHDADATLALEVTRRRVDGTNPESDPASVELDVYATAGEIRWSDAGNPQIDTLKAPAHRLFTNGPPGPEAPEFTAQDFPNWIKKPDERTPIEKRASEGIDEALQPDRPITLGLKELSTDKRVEISSLALQCLAEIDEFDSFVTSLTDSTQRLSWNTQVEALRKAIARSPQTATLVREAFEHHRGPKGTELYRMLWGYSIEQLQAGAAAQLVKYLDSEDLDFRVLSFWNLSRIAGATHYYRPEFTAVKRAAAVRAWKQKLDSGQLIPKSTEAMP